MGPLPPSVGGIPRAKAFVIGSWAADRAADGLDWLLAGTNAYSRNGLRVKSVWRSITLGRTSIEQAVGWQLAAPWSGWPGLPGLRQRPGWSWWALAGLEQAAGLLGLVGSLVGLLLARRLLG